MMLRKHNRLPYLQTIAKRLLERITGIRHKKTKSMQNPNAHGESQKNPGLVLASIAVAAGAAVLHDYLKGGREIAALRTETELLTNPVIDAEQTVIWFVGCMQDGKDAYDNLTPITNGINLIVPRLPQTSHDGKIDQNDMCEKIVDQLLTTRAKRPVLIGDSRGVLDAIALMQYVDRMGLRDKFDGFGKVIGNASPHDGEDITDSRRRLLLGAKILEHFSTPNRIKPFFMRKFGHGSSAEATLSETVLAGRNIQQARAVNPIPALFEEFIYVHGPYNDDPTVRRKEAAEKFRQDTPLGLFREYIDHTRKPGAHIGNRERYASMLNIAEILPTVLVNQAPDEVIVHFRQQPMAA